jgi:hypothetical protein
MLKRAVFTVLLLLFPLAGGADDRRYDVPIGDAPYIGPADAPVTIIEFIDFQ